MKTVLMTLLACAAIFGQSRDELKAKYGNAVSEPFIVRPGIGVTATYSATGKIVELLIAPQNTNLIKSRSSVEHELSHDILKVIIDELVPMSTRGKYIIGTFMDIVCLPQNDCFGSQEDYERLTIYYNSGKGDVNYAVVQWKQRSSN